MIRKSLYATNVHHYDHVLMAMSEVFGDVSLVRQFQVTPVTLKRAEKLRAPAPMLKILRRRMRLESSIPTSVRTFGIAQAALPSLTRLGFGIKPRHVRMVTSAYARTVSAAARGKDVFHFVEGLGHRALTGQSFGLTICERRNFHHRVFEQPLEPHDGFPTNARLDPLRDYLDCEYELSDYIMVYSDAAKRSFTERGFDSSKVLVAPIGIGSQLPRLISKRDQHRLAYVGRGDIYKGIDVAVAAVREMGYPYRLTVAGPMSPEVRSWLLQQRHVDYVGILDRAGLRALYSTAGALVLPSVESYGLAAAEAAYHGLPLVCSNFTGIAEYLPSSSYSTVIGRDPRAWAQALLSALERGAPSVPVEGMLRGLDLDSTSNLLRNIYQGLNENL